MSCIPFSNKESEWLPEEQILPLPGFLSKPLAQVVKGTGAPGCARNKRAPTPQSLLPKPSVWALAGKVPPLPVHLTEPVLFSGPFQSRTALGRKDCSSWDPWQSADEESVVKHRQGSTCTLCPWCKCPRQAVVRMGSALCCDWVQTQGLQEQLGSGVNREVKSCLLLKSYLWDKLQNQPLPNFQLRKTHPQSSRLACTCPSICCFALNLLSLTPLEAISLLGSVGWVVSIPWLDDLKTPWVKNLKVKNL